VATAIALGALALLVYTYVGYPILIALLARLRPLRTQRDDNWLPTVTACIPIFNAAGYLPAKLDSLLALDYPADKFDIILLSDGSTDETDAIAAKYAAEAHGRITVMRNEVRSGKPTALNRMRALARGEVLLLTDVRQPLVPPSLRAMVARLADPAVACVSGNLTLPGSAGAGVYWKYENWIRRNEARFSSMLGVTGPIYVIRKTDLPEVPLDVILDDMWIPMRLRLAGRRLLFCEEAIALDEAFGDEREFGRKVRTLAGNYQLLARLPRLLVPVANPSWLELLSHKVLRLLGPWLIVAFFAASLLAAAPWQTAALTVSAVWLMRALALGQAFLFLLALAGPRAGRAGVVYRTFMVLNAAALVGLWRFVSGRQKITW
jgi:biofilm PGA synthesis N-glycosyltransferase PgaC